MRGRIVTSTSTSPQIPCHQHSWRAAEMVCLRCERPMCGLCAVGLQCKPCAQERQPAASVAESAATLAQAGVIGLVDAFVVSVVLNLVIVVLYTVPLVGAVLGLLSPLVVGIAVGETVSLAARGRVSALLRLVAALDILVPVIGSRLLLAYIYTGKAASAFTPSMLIVVFFACVAAVIASGRVRSPR